MIYNKEEALKYTFTKVHILSILIGDTIFSSHRKKKVAMPELRIKYLKNISRELLAYEVKKRNKLNLLNDIMIKAIEKDQVEAILLNLFNNIKLDRRYTAEHANNLKRIIIRQVLDSLNESLLESNFRISGDENRVIISKVEYEEGFVAFLDILGFKEAIQMNDKFYQIYETFQYIKSLQKDSLKNEYQGNCKITYFSDSIVISSSSLSSVIIDSAIFSIQVMNVLNLGVRGGIAYGKYFHMGNIIFGPALVEAYQLEDERAILSRILLSKEAVIHDERLTNKYFLFENIGDDYAQVNIYDAYLSSLIDIPYLELRKQKEWIEGIIDKYKEMQDNSIRSKYEWLMIPFNKTCLRYGEKNKKIMNLMFDQTKLVKEKVPV